MKRILLLIFMSMVITACGAPIKPGPATDENPAAANEQGGVTAGAVGGSGVSSGTALVDGKRVSYEKGAINDPANILSERNIYFAFDSNDVPDKYLDLIKYHGHYLSLYPKVKVRLEGHTDERGSREYNMALGERRAQAVKQLLLMEGVAEDQITVISYGEEKPVAFGHDEKSMQLNRRVEIVYE